MISRRLLLTASAVLAATAFPVFAGERFIRLTKEIPNAKGTLIKVFSYDCPFCYKYDASIDPFLRQHLGKTLVFTPMHLESRARFGRVASLFFAYAILKDKAEGKDPENGETLFSKAKESLYFAYLKKKERWDAGEKAFIATLCEATGISEKEFQHERENPAVVALADSWRNIEPASKLQGIPAYIVNGKYLIETKSIRSKKDFLSLVNEIAAYE